MRIFSIWSKIKEFIEFIISNTKFDVIDKLPKIYSKAGVLGAPLLWIFFPFLESWISPIPLTVIVASNISAAKGMFGAFGGYIIGYLCSYIGETLGAISVFLFCRYVVKKLIVKGVMKSDKWKKRMEEYHKKVNPSSGAGSLFILVATPFSPSAIVNVVYGISSMNVNTFVKTVIVGKSFMILLLSLFTRPFELMMDNLLYMIIGLILMMIAWYIMKKLDPKIQEGLNKISNKINRE